MRAKLKLRLFLLREPCHFLIILRLLLLLPLKRTLHPRKFLIRRHRIKLICLYILLRHLLNHIRNLRLLNILKQMQEVWGNVPPPHSKIPQLLHCLLVRSLWGRLLRRRLEGFPGEGAKDPCKVHLFINFLFY